MKDHVVFGLIGAGGIASSQHLPNLSRARGIRLKTVCDLQLDRLRAAQGKYHVPHVETDYRNLLADPDIDVVLIATREDLHASLAIEALRAGKHVYVEKPLAETPESCAQVAEAQSQCRRLLAVGHNRRLAPAYQLARRIFLAHGGARNIHYRISDAYYIWGRAYGPGRRIIHETCHVFDILRFLTGSEVARVYCVASRPDD